VNYVLQGVTYNAITIFDYTSTERAAEYLGLVVHSIISRPLHGANHTQARVHGSLRIPPLWHYRYVAR